VRDSGYPPPMTAIADLARDAAGCTNCELYADATQVVFGQGRPGARLMLVGEQPGDREDVEGAPFVGPAGRLLDQALDRAGVAREDAYVTNVVKHFRFRREGKRRIHRTPGVEHVRACLPWLRGELDAVAPQVVVTLGATAAKALLGSGFRLTQHRGEVLGAPELPGLPLVATIHPSAVLRGPQDRRTAALDELVDDLALARRTVDAAPHG
jgi:uracil-DNA glycosylase